MVFKQNHCCGAQDPVDWDLNVYFSCNETHRSREKCGVPFSCCITDPAVSRWLINTDLYRFSSCFRLIQSRLFQDSVVNTQCGYDVRNKPKVSSPSVWLLPNCPVFNSRCSGTEGVGWFYLHQRLHRSVGRLVTRKPLHSGHRLHRHLFVASMIQLAVTDQQWAIMQLQLYL